MHCFHTSIISLFCSFVITQFTISELINATNPTGKVLEVIPVMRSDPTSLAFHDHLLEAITSFKGVRLATPVMYAPSEYPKSDAFQVESSAETIHKKIGFIIWYQFCAVKNLFFAQFFGQKYPKEPESMFLRNQNQLITIE